MGGGGSRHYRSYAQLEAERHRKEQRAQRSLKRKLDENAKNEARKKERDSWLRNYRGSLEKKWWHTGWWPLYEWWKEHSAWKQELHRRQKERLFNAEGVPLRTHHDY